MKSDSVKAHLKRRKWLYVLVILAVVAYVVWPADESSNQSKNVEIVTPQRGRIEETVTAQGKLEPKEYVDVGAQVSGQLKKVHIEIGDVVKKGDLIAEIDPKVYESRVQADEARLKTLKAQLAEQQASAVLAKQQYERNERLIVAKAISQEELETTQSEFNAANARIASIRAQIEEAESTLAGDVANLSYTKIFAPIDGTVVLQTSKEGQTLNANQSAPVVVQLANLDIMMIRAQVAEADVMRLKPEMEVYFTTLGAIENKWQAKIRQILPSPEIINDVVLYNALIDVENKERQLMTGMSVQIFFLLGKADNVLTIPANALGKREAEKDGDKGQAYSIKVKTGKNVTERTVWVGLMNRTVAEVKSGLSGGEQVVVAGSAPKDEKKQAGGGAGRGPRI